jgi:hypothetical protein
MALYESLDQQNRNDTASRQGTSERSRFVAVLRLVLVGVLLACWLGGAYGGIAYWSLQGSLLGVLVSAIVAGAGAAFTWTLFTGLEHR